MPLFNQETLNILKRLGFSYLVVNRKAAMGYARKESTPRNTLEFLELEEYEIVTMKPTDIEEIEEQEIDVSRW